jgi:hypothetical protein
MRNASIFEQFRHLFPVFLLSSFRLYARMALGSLTIRGESGEDAGKWWVGTHPTACCATKQLRCKSSTAKTMSAMMKKFSKTDQISLAAWSLDCAQRVLGFFERSAPEDVRPHQALETGREWARTGVFSMSAIRGASLAAHAAAKDLKSDHPACFAAHACGQAVATAHVAQHAYGGAYYALKALAASDPQKAARLVATERDWQSHQLPTHLREEVMGRIVVEQRRSNLYISIRKGPDF